MPKRMVDGDALWVSEKLTHVPEKYRAEYAWLLPLTQVNGAFECSPMLVWRTCYSALRSSWSIDDVAAMLDAFETEKMLFRWSPKPGKTFGMFIGVQKEGRLPKPSDRLKSAKEFQSGIVPAKELAKFLGVSVKEVDAEYGELLASNSRPTRDKGARKSPAGIGSGVGVGDGSGIGCGEGIGKGIAQGIAQGVGVGEAADNTATQRSNTSFSSHSKHQNQNDNTQHHNTATPSRLGSSFDLDEEEEDEEGGDSSVWSYPPYKDDRFDNLTELGLADVFRLILRENPHAGEPPKGWREMWAKDFKTLLQGLTVGAVLDLIVVSQIEKNQPFYVRSKTLVDRQDMLRDMVEERAKLMPTLRSEFKKAYNRLSGEEWKRDIRRS